MSNQTRAMLPLGADSAVPNSSFLLRVKGNGVDQSTLIRDFSQYNRPLTVLGNTKVSTAQSAFGGASILFDGLGDYLSFPLFSITGDFTVEGYFYKVARFGSSQSAIIGGNGGSSATNTQFMFDYINNGSFGLVLGQSIVFNSPANTLPTGQFFHGAWTRQGGVCRGFVNGQLVASGNSANTAACLTMGGFATGAGVSNYFNGYMNDDVAILNFCRYTAAFTPPNPLY